MTEKSPGNRNEATVRPGVWQGRAGAGMDQTYEVGAEMRAEDGRAGVPVGAQGW